MPSIMKLLQLVSSELTETARRSGGDVGPRSTRKALWVLLRNADGELREYREVASIQGKSLMAVLMSVPSDETVSSCRAGEAAVTSTD